MNLYNQKPEQVFEDMLFMGGESTHNAKMTWEEFSYYARYVKKSDMYTFRVYTYNMSSNT